MELLFPLTFSVVKLVKVYLKDNGTRGLTSDLDDTVSPLLFEKFAFPHPSDG